ncbi:hypothetical protein RKD46_005237 [Streptomyces pseudovenezuelae]
MNILSGARVAAEEARQVAVEDGPGRVGVLADLEPGHRVDELVHADRDQRAVDEAEERGAEGAEAGHPLTEVGDDVADGLPAQDDQDAEDRAYGGRDDRDEPAAVEEAEPVDELLAVVALPEHGRQQPEDDAAEHAGVLEARRLRGLRALLPEAAAQAGRRVGGALVPVLDRVLVDHRVVREESHHGCQGRRTVRLLREADGDADAEEQGEAEGAVQQGAAGTGEHLRHVGVYVEPLLRVRLSETQQDTRRRQHGDRQLKAAAYLLQALEQA